MDHAVAACLIRTGRDGHPPLSLPSWGCHCAVAVNKIIYLISFTCHCLSRAGFTISFLLFRISFFDQSLTFIFLNLKPKSPTFRTEIRFPVSSENGKKYRNFGLSDRNGEPCSSYKGLKFYSFNERTSWMLSSSSIVKEKEIDS